MDGHGATRDGVRLAAARKLRLGKSARFVGSVLAQMRASPAKDAGESRCRCGGVPVQMPGAEPARPVARRAGLDDLVDPGQNNRRRPRSSIIEDLNSPHLPIRVHMHMSHATRAERRGIQNPTSSIEHAACVARHGVEWSGSYAATCPSTSTCTYYTLTHTRAHARSNAPAIAGAHTAHGVACACSAMRTHLRQRRDAVRGARDGARTVRPMAVAVCGEPRKAAP